MFEVENMKKKYEKKRKKKKSRLVFQYSKDQANHQTSNTNTLYSRFI